MNEMEEGINKFIQTRHDVIIKQLDHEVAEELMDSFGYVKPVMFATLSKYKWLEYVSKQ